MASSNRHWPSMFKSKPCNTHHHWQHDINPSLTTSGCHRPSYTSVPGGEERSPEPKPRWNPKPEQIRILEAIFNSGMVNPPKEEIRKIRAQLQDYGQVGDANVFYWFQNRKSRSKHKQRHVQATKSQAQTTPISAMATINAAPASSSSSSWEKFSQRRTSKTNPIGGANVIHVSTSPTALVNSYGEFSSDSEPFFPVQLTGDAAPFSRGFCFSELPNIVEIPDQVVGPCSTSLILSSDQGTSKKEEVDKMKLGYTPTTPTVTPTTTVCTNINQMQGIGESSAIDQAAAPKSTVIINDVAFEVSVGPFNVRETFEDDAVLIDSCGQPVLTNEWGFTLHSLQHGTSYYLVRTLSFFQ
ncbi:hypothetical protein HHK36_001795 [Tetracentron sinense]|uniref:Homeobox domain-containing protein n=1 Tax=Tetracentron sinense TaxID=13715 RepID=A0A834ZWQ5_TETSI|nr:hypothetical protein HHK36_001795 [Tetracentron sinense]